MAFQHDYEAFRFAYKTLCHNHGLMMSPGDSNNEADWHNPMLIIPVDEDAAEYINNALTPDQLDDDE